MKIKTANLFWVSAAMIYKYFNISPGSSMQLYWVLSGNDFTLDINDPKHPKIVGVGNNPEKQQIYGAVLSLYISRLVRQVNKKGMLKFSLIFDEFPPIYFNNMDSLGLQSTEKGLRQGAGRCYCKCHGQYHQRTGNGATAKLLSERFGKIMQDRQSISVNRTDTSISHSRQLDSAVPTSKITALSSGEFVELVADNPDEKIKLKCSMQRSLTMLTI